MQVNNIYNQVHNKMQGRSCYILCENKPISMIRFAKQMNCSLSTSGSNSPRQSHDSLKKSSMMHNKEKSQLCKKFMENGYCPYQNKCKFAHGCHELKRNQQTNCKYKTKQCGVYINQGYCPYGQRCNFIHQKVKVQHQIQKIDEQLIVIRAFRYKQSRLLKLLE